ncbi:MAG: DUF1178 family protein [bacterium]|nr:MAG: DUF1178 family protein [bacterium]
MIIYDLKCSQGHTFEGWFKGRDEFDTESAFGRLTCPVCGVPEVDIVPSGGHISRSAPERSGHRQAPEHSKTKLLMEYIEKNFDNVGPKFAEEAIKIHFGEIDARNIRGTMTVEEEQDLQDEGIGYWKVPFPKFQS